MRGYVDQQQDCLDCTKTLQGSQTKLKQAGRLKDHDETQTAAKGAHRQLADSVGLHSEQTLAHTAPLDMRGVFRRKHCVQNPSRSPGLQRALCKEPVHRRRSFVQNDFQ